MGALADAITKMIRTVLESSTWTSAGGKNPVDNFIKEFRGEESPDLLDIIEDEKDTTPKFAKEKKKDVEITKTVDGWKKGNVGELSSLGSAQFNNVMQFAKNPFTFITGAFMRKFAKGAGAIALAAIIFAAVKVVISELLAPGRLLDIRFKRDIRKEIIAFRRREDQQKLKQGFSNIIITTMPRLRGGQNQVINTLDITRTQTFSPAIGQSNLIQSSAGLSLGKNKGSGKMFGIGP